jgi:predicted transcriptional regulator
LAKVGKWYPLAERLSRWARIRLLRVILKKQTQIGIARMCGVSRQAVSNWLTKEAYHPNDMNASVLLKLAWQVDKKCVKRILRAEAKRYLLELKKIGIAS